MKAPKRADRRWFVVQVWRGIPERIEAYREEGEAGKRERSLRDSLGPEDEVAVFEIDLANEPAVSA